jgi:hypothetical protein
MANAIRRGKEEGLEWWTARQINAWERARRGVLLKSFDARNVTLESKTELEDATVLISTGGPASAGRLSAWGASFRATTKTVTGSQRIDVE